MGHTFELSGSPTEVAGALPPIAPARPAGTDDSTRLQSYKTELDEFRAMVSRFIEQDPSEILGVISGIAGRVAEIRADLMRINTPRCVRLRTTEVDPLREDLDFQFRIHSRRITVLEWEYKLSGGGI